MSYDLYLHGGAAFGLDEFTAYFTGRPNYTCANKQAVYGNESTGVYFTFDLADDDADPPHAIAFNLNFYRPHFFALEAAPEVAALVEHFGFGVTDPQSEGMGDGPFSIEGFLRGWNHGNDFGYHAILNSENPPDKIRSRPGTELEAIWRWNMEKDKIQAALSEDIFVPRIFWGVLDDEMFSMVVWPDGIRTLIPVVDMLVIGRKELAPRRFFRKTEDTCYIPRAQLEHVLSPLETKSWPMPAHFPRYGIPPPELRKLIEGLKADGRKFGGIAMDSVLNQELVEAARKSK